MLTKDSIVVFEEGKENFDFNGHNSSESEDDENIKTREESVVEACPSN